MHLWNHENAQVSKTRVNINVIHSHPQQVEQRSLRYEDLSCKVEDVDHIIRSIVHTGFEISEYQPM